MKTVLYIHGVAGNSDDNIYKALVDFYKNKFDFKVIAVQLDKLYTDVSETQKQIDSVIKENDVKILVGESLAGFYISCCNTNARKILINPCMHPSLVINFIRDDKTGEQIEIEEKVLSDWEYLESLKHNSVINIVGNESAPIFKNDFFDFLLLDDEEYSNKVKFLNDPFWNLLGNKEIKVSGEIKNIQLIELPEFNNEPFCRFWVNGEECVIIPRIYQKYFKYLKINSQVIFHAVQDKIDKLCFFNYLISIIPENGEAL